jgi:Zn finger protein HypA/HybF involved in hydrogenase expression
MSNDEDEGESDEQGQINMGSMRPITPSLMREAFEKFRAGHVFQGANFLIENETPAQHSQVPANPKLLNLTPEGIREAYEKEAKTLLQENEIETRINGAYYRGFETAKNQYEYSLYLTQAQLNNLADSIRAMSMYTDSERYNFAEQLALGMGIDEVAFVKLCKKNK